MAGPAQDFVLREGEHGLPGEYVCAGCQAAMIMGGEVGESPTGTLTMEHAENCEEVRRLRGVQG